MEEDASLDDFLADSREATSDPDDDADESVPVGGEAVEAAESTYAWSPDGGACGACGTSVERRWRGESGLVCAECKDW